MPEPTHTHDLIPPPRPTRELHALMGELIDISETFADLAPLLAPAAHWEVYHGRLHISAHGARSPGLLRTAARLLGGTVRLSGRTLTGPAPARLHTLHTEMLGVPVEVRVWLPEPSEGEEPLARLDATGGAL